MISILGKLLELADPKKIKNPENPFKAISGTKTNNTPNKYIPVHSNNNDSSGSSDSSGDNGDNSSSNGDSDSGEAYTGEGTGNTTQNNNQSTMSQAEKNALFKMKDSNVPYYYKINENDLLNLAASEKTNDFREFKEDLFLYTTHDRKKHRYMTSVQIDADKDDIVTTCQIEMPYENKLMEYWIPGQTAFMVMGGVYDREVLFIGRVSEVNQIGSTIQVVAQNIGWRFKQYMSEEFFNKIKGLPIPLVVRAIIRELGFEEGKYHIDLWAIPDIFKYTLDENNTVTYGGEEVYNVPDLEKVIKNIGDSDVNKYVATKAKLRETKEVAKDYAKSTQIRNLDSVINATNTYYPSSYRKSYGVKSYVGESGEIGYLPLMDRLLSTEKGLKLLTEDHSGDGEYTYEETLRNIATAIDAQFFIVDTTVCFVSFNALMTMSSSQAIAKSIQPTIQFWQMEQESYELDINQYGYYNTVIIKYKNGTLKRSYEDLVRVFGEVPITYKEPDLTYAAAQMKAQAYLAAHVRDFGMEINLTILYSGKITPSTFIKVLNPLTMSESLYYVAGTSIVWYGENQTLTCDLNLLYGPSNQDLEVPETGATFTSGGTQSAASANVSPNVAQAAQQIVGGATDPTQKGAMIYNWVDQNISYERYSGNKYTSAQVLSGHKANCYDTAYLVYNLCTAAGVRCEVWNGTYHFLDETIGHLWNRIEQNGQMVFGDAGRQSHAALGTHGGSGRYIVSGSCVKKNY